MPVLKLMTSGLVSPAAGARLDLIPSGLGSPNAGLSLNARDAPVGGTVARSVPLWSVVVSFARVNSRTSR